MRLIHLSDLHIGKRVNEFSMSEDQKYILAQILAIVDKEAVDGVIIAGDVYDKPIPSAEAVQIFDGFLTKLADRNIPVFVISGNHDSAERLAFGAQLMSSRSVYMSPVYDGEITPVRLSDGWGDVCIWLMPFIKPSIARHALDREDILSYEDAVGAVVERMALIPEERNILVAHQFVTGASRCESEDVSVGGVDNVDASLFDAFDYVALGHIHSPQHVGRETVRYCGTPLKYSFSEAEQKKSVTLVELSEKGNVAIREILLTPLRDMRKLRGTYMELTALSFYKDSNTQDYIQVTLTDEQDVPDGLQKLRVIYPNLMRLEYDNQRTREIRQVEGSQKVELKSELELLEEFYELQNNQPMNDSQKEFSGRLIQEIREKIS